MYFLWKRLRNGYLSQSQPLSQLLNKSVTLVKECFGALYQPYSYCSATLSLHCRHRPWTSTDSACLTNPAQYNNQFFSNVGMKTGIITQIIDQFLSKQVLVPKIHPLWRRLVSVFHPGSGCCLFLMSETQTHASFNKDNFWKMKACALNLLISLYT